jgi:beta-glucosidase
MAALLPLLLPLLAPIVNAQSYDAAVRNEDAFSYVQPLNTTILGAYGHSCHAVAYVLPTHLSKLMRQ